MSRCSAGIVAAWWGRRGRVAAATAEAKESVVEGGRRAPAPLDEAPRSRRPTTPGSSVSPRSRRRLRAPRGRSGSACSREAPAPAGNNVDNSSSETQDTRGTDEGDARSGWSTEDSSSAETEATLAVQVHAAAPGEGSESITHDAPPAGTVVAVDAPGSALVSRECGMSRRPSTGEEPMEAVSVLVVDSFGLADVGGKVQLEELSAAMAAAVEFPHGEEGEEGSLLEVGTSSADCGEADHMLLPWEEPDTALASRSSLQYISRIPRSRGAAASPKPRRLEARLPSSPRTSKDDISHKFSTRIPRPSCRDFTSASSPSPPRQGQGPEGAAQQTRRGGSVAATRGSSPVVAGSSLPSRNAAAGATAAAQRLQRRLSSSLPQPGGAAKGGARGV